MRYIKLGSSQIKISVLGCGSGSTLFGFIEDKTDSSQKDNIVRTINTAIENGVNYIDTAPAYGGGASEETIARVLKGKRDKVIVATKCGVIWHEKKGEFIEDIGSRQVYKYLGKGSIKYELEQSLRRLGTDYIDLYLTHLQDATTPIEETMEALRKLKDQGKIRAIGVCTDSLEILKEYVRYGTIDALQTNYNLRDRMVEDDILPYIRKNNITFIAFTPLKRGKIFKSDPEGTGPEKKKTEAIEKIFREEVEDIASKYRLSIHQYVIAWLASQPGISIICGTTDSNHAISNAAAGNIVIDREDISRTREMMEKLF